MVLGLRIGAGDAEARRLLEKEEGGPIRDDREMEWGSWGRWW